MEKQEQALPPVDMSKLAGILKGAKNIMKKVESGDYETGNIDTRALTEEGVNELMAEGVKRPMAAKKISSGAPTITEEAIRNSKMPDIIKRVMINNPIPQAQFPTSFSLDDVQDIVNDEQYERVPKYQKAPIKKAPVRKQITENESYVTGLSEEEVRTIVKDELIEFFTKYFTKTLSEEVQKKVINQLLESGKIKVKRA